MVGPEEDVKDFLESVDEVSRLIDGLQKGTISPEYVDRKHADKLQRDQQEQQGAALIPAARGKPTPAAPAAAAKGKQDTSAEDAEAAAKAKQDEEERKERLMEKARELAANRERKLKAREKYEQYVQSCADQTSAATDYRKWDMWCPEDEEDDLINSITPNTPAFRALEKDIDERHNRMVEQRQIAERQRVAGNDAFKAGQWSEALRCYQAGLDAERTNMTLHANAAQAALKLHCYVQAVEHGDKVLNIADFLHNNTKTPLCAKAYMRRAQAYRAMGQLQRAVEDLTHALDILPEDKELNKLKSKADLELSEHLKEKQVSTALKTGTQQQQGTTNSTTSSTTTTGTTAPSLNVDKLRRVEQLIATLRSGSNDPAAAATPATPAQPPPQQQGGTTHSQAQPQPQSGLQGGAEQQGGSTDAGAKAATATGTHGPKLPPPARKARPAAKPAAAAAAAGGSSGVQSAVGSQRSVAAELRGLLEGDDVCCVYYRECEGVGATAEQLIGLADKEPQQQTADLLLLLNTAAMNDGNVLQTVKHRGLLPALWGFATSKHTDVALATATLLCTLTTVEDARAALSASLAQPLAGVLAAVAAAPPQSPLRALLLLVLSNCAVDAQCKAAFKSAITTQSVAQTFLTTLTECVDSPNASVAERAATLVANLSSDPTLRATITAHAALIVGLARALVGAPGKGQASGAETAARKAIATALYNLSVEPQAQQTLAQNGFVSQAVGLIQGEAGDMPLVALVVGMLARCVKQPAATAAALQQGAVPALVGLIQRCVGMPHGGSSDAQPSAAAAGAATVSALDGAVRALTVVLSAAPDSDASAADAVVAAGGAAALHATLASPAANPATIGNAALAVASIARYPSMLDKLANVCGKAREGESDDAPQGVPSSEEAGRCLVAALVRAAYQGQGTVAAKNAGIALARLAAHRPLLARLKELRGLEIIHASVKSL